MLQFKTINESTLDLLKQIMLHPYFNEVYLCGGTSLALQIGHRKSIDIDLFGSIEPDEITISGILSEFGTTTIIKKTKNILIYSVNSIKVDIVNYPYPLLHDVISDSGIRMAHKSDIAAMKLAAITGRGSKKDFIDLYFLLRDFSLKEMMEFYSMKFKEGSVFLVLKSLSYFDDADSEPDPFMIFPIDWQDVKIKIIQSMEEFIK